MSRLVRNTVLSTIAVGLAGCIHVYEHKQPTSTPTPTGAAPTAAAAAAKPEEKGPFKPWDETLKDTKAIDGYFKLHRKRDNTLFFELRPDQLDKDFGLVMHISKGTGVFNIQDGLPLSESNLMQFRRSGDKIYLVHVNTRFTADANSPMLTSMKDNVGNSIVAAFNIASEHKESKALLIDATPFLVSDYAQVADNIKWYYGQKPVSFDNTRSYVDNAQSFAKNTEIDAMLTFRASDFPLAPSAGVSDFRSIPVGVRYSFFALPEKPMQARRFDDRVGFFTDAVRDFSDDKNPNPIKRMITRWRLEKKNPQAEMSEPVNPIVYYLDRSIPTEYRPIVKEAIENWNRAFEKAGFINAVVAREAPENDPAWSAEDIRYSTVRWTAAHSMGYAIGPSQTDPRTGEILNADILISSEFVTGWASTYQTLSTPEALSAAIEAERMPFATNMPMRMKERLCMLESGMQRQMHLQYEWLVANGDVETGDPLPQEYLRQALLELIMHEVGHTLGLRHNMKASSAIAYDKLHDKDFTLKHGLTLSVMDYAPVNIAPNSKNQGLYYAPQVGSYDEWAITYGYAPIYEQPGNGPLVKASGAVVTSTEAELPGLRKIASLAADNFHTYGTDEDTHLGPQSVDPNSNTWDLGSDPLKFAADRIQLMEIIKPKLERRLVADGDGFNRLRGSVTGQIFTRYSVLAPVTKSIGGMNFVRDHKGDPNGRQPFTPLSAARQREALDLVIKRAFTEDAFEFEPALLNKLTPTRNIDWAGTWLVVPIDYPVHDMVNTVQSWLLEDLLHGTRLKRMVDNGKRTNGEQFTVAEMFDRLGNAIFSELGNGRSPRNVDSYRRNLQRSYIDQMSRVLLNRAAVPWFVPVPEDARSLARYEFAQLSQQLDQALKSNANLNVETKAHLAESKARVDAILEASVTVAPR